MAWPSLLVDVWMLMDIMFDEVTIIEPPKPILKSEYKCDKSFHVDSVLSLYDQPEICGLIWIDGQNTTFYSIDMTSLDSQKIDDRSTRLKKHNKGGQSAARFGRLHQESVTKYLKGIAEDTREHFSNENTKTIIIGGHGKKRAQLVPYLSGDIRTKLIGTITLTEKDTIPDTYEKMKITYNEYQVREEEQLLGYFDDHIQNDTNKAIYGPVTVKKYLKNGYLERIYVDQDYYGDRIYQVEKVCKRYGCNLILIGKSSMSHTLIQSYGHIFGVSWFVIETN